MWGYNGSGRLGNGNTTQQSTPVDVSGLTTGVQAITAGDYHGCALTTGGGVRCWGENSKGQLGNGNTTQQLTSVNVTGLSSGVRSVAAGGQHTCAVTSLDGAKCWGWNGKAQLGNASGGSTTAYVNAPGDVSAMKAGVQSMTTGTEHTYALNVAGGVRCWGASGAKLGFETSLQATAADVRDLTNVAAMSAGLSHSYALGTNGALNCWGENSGGLAMALSLINSRLRRLLMLPTADSPSPPVITTHARSLMAE